MGVHCLQIVSVFAYASMTQLTAPVHARYRNTDTKPNERVYAINKTPPWDASSGTSHFLIGGWVTIVHAG